jgi:hypothetical protein
MSRLVKATLAISLLGLLGCGTRSDLRTKDAAPFVDDDIWLKIDAATGPVRDGGAPDALDARPG